MKRLVLLSISAVLFAFSAYSQNIKDVDLKDYTLELKSDGSLNLVIDVDLSHLKMKTTQVVVLTPAVINGNDTLMLKSIGVYGRNRRIVYLRNQEDKPTGGDDLDISSSQTSDVVKYSASVPFQDWMNGCRVELVRTDYGCCGHYDSVSLDELVERFPVEMPLPELIYIKPEHEVVKTRQICGSAFVDYPVSQTDIYPSYRNNEAELAKITGTIDSVKRDSDITIKSIHIKGYASPESLYDNNTRLAKGRTESLKEYVEGLYHFGAGFITTDFEPEDWDGLEKYVMASSLQHKDEILEVIRSGRDPDVREWIIKSRWKDDYRFLLENCYPALRHSDYIIRYEIRGYATPAEIEAVLYTSPQNLSLEEFYILAQTYEPGSEEFSELFETAVRMYPDAPVANLNAANSAILRKEYGKALRYLERAGDLPEAVYARGALEIYMDDLTAAKPFLEKARKLGVNQAETVLKDISTNRYIYKMSNEN